MKKVFAILMSFVALVSFSVPASAYTRESTEILDGEMIGKAYSGFYYTPKLERVGAKAFIDCYYLSQFCRDSFPDLPEFHLNYIGDYAFAGCGNLTVMDVPTATYFGDYSLFGCTNIASLVLSKDITYIGKYAIGYTGKVSIDRATQEVSITDISQDPSVILRVHAGTVSEDYAKENLFNHQYCGDSAGTWYVVGDFNADGVVSINDCQEMLKSYVDRLSGKAQPTDIYTVRNDLNNDDCTDVIDAQMILRYYTESKTAGKTYTWFDLRKDMGMV